MGRDLRISRAHRFYMYEYTHADCVGRCGTVGRTFQTVCLFVFLFVRGIYNSKANDSKVFKLGVGNGLGICTRRDMVLG